MDYLPYPLSQPMRRAIMIFLIMLFLLICPILILYTAGYHYSFQERAFVTTGVLSIDVLPKEATVLVRGVPIQKALPMRIQNLLPNTYPVTIEHPGYMSWSKDMDVRSNQTTYIKGVELFREAAPYLVHQQQPEQNLYPSLQGEFFLISEHKDEEMIFFLSNFDLSQKRKIFTLPSNTSSSVSWSLDSNWFTLTTWDTKNTIVRLFDAKNDRNYEHTLTGAYQTSQWGYGGEPVVFVETTDSIFRLQGGVRTVLDSNTEPGAWYAENSTLYRFVKDAKEIHRYSGGKILEKFSLPLEITQIYHLNQQRIIGKTDNNSLVILRHTDNLWQETTRFRNDYKTRYNPATREWNVFTPWELSTVYEDGSVVLLNRTSEAMEWVTALDNNGVLLVQTKNKLLAFNPGYYLTHTLFSGEETMSITTAPMVDKKNRIIYFFANIDGRAGLYGREF